MASLPTETVVDSFPWGLLHAAKSDRLRQAKAEAEKEIAAYKAEREGAYQKKLAEVRVRSERLAVT